MCVCGPEADPLPFHGPPLTIDGKDVLTNFFIRDKGMSQKRPVFPPILSQVYTLIYLQYGVYSALYIPGGLGLLNHQQ